MSTTATTPSSWPNAMNMEVAKLLGDTVTKLAGISQKATQSFDTKMLPGQGAARKYMTEHPLAHQRDRFTASAGASAKDGLTVFAENAAIYLPGDNELHGVDEVIGWGCAMRPEEEGKDFYATHQLNKENPFATLPDAKTDVSLKTLLSIGGIHQVKCPKDGEDPEDAEPITKVTCIELKGNSENAQSQFYFPAQNWVPSFPMIRLTSKDQVKAANDSPLTPKGDYKIGDYAPDVKGFYLQWANCTQTIAQMLCDESDAEFELPSGCSLKQAADGYLASVKDYVSKHPEYSKKLEDDVLDLLEIQGEPTKVSEVISSLSSILPAYRDSYVFLNSKATSAYDPKHPLALQNLNAHYQMWIMKSMDDLNGKEYPTMAMIRAYAMAHDAFALAIRRVSKGGAYFEWPAGPLVRRGEKTKTGREKLDDVLSTYSVIDQVKFLLTYTSSAMKRTHDGLWRAFNTSKAKAPTKQAKIADFQREIAELKKEVQPHLFLVMDYAVRMNNKVARAMDKSFEHLPSDLKGYEIFAEERARASLSEAISMGTWVVYHLNKNPKQAKPEYMKITDAEIQMMLANSAKSGLSPTFADDLRKEIAKEHEISFFTTLDKYNGVCQKTKGHTISFVNVRTNQKVPHQFIAWETMANGEQTIKIDMKAMEAAGKGGDDFDALKADQKAGYLVAECDNVIMVDGSRPYILPAAPLTKEQFDKMLGSLKKSDPSKGSLWFKAQGRMVTADPRAIERFTKAGATVPVIGDIDHNTKTRKFGVKNLDETSGIARPEKIDKETYNRVTKGL